MNVFILIIALCFPVKAQNIYPNVVISTESKNVENIYKPNNYRDPMVMPANLKESNYNIKISTVSSSSFSIKDLSLVGMLQYEEGVKEALVRDGNMSVYTVKDGKLYNDKKKPIKDIKCFIKNNQVVIRDLKSKEEVILVIK
jgi:hypothetical protein